MRCAALVGAGPDKAPHRQLEEIGYQPSGIIHRCMRCHTSWTAGKSGWTRAGASPASP
jgi:hypothetical protein